MASSKSYEALRSELLARRQTIDDALVALERIRSVLEPQKEVILAPPLTPGSTANRILEFGRAHPDGFSTRALREALSGTPRATVNAALRRLQRRQAIEPVERGAGARPATYRLTGEDTGEDTGDEDE